jgi:hypothetical protein
MQVVFYCAVLSIVALGMKAVRRPDSRKFANPAPS